MKTNYTQIMKRNGGEVFCEQHDMEEFYNHGLLILEWFKKKRGMYFSKKGYELVVHPCSYNADGFVEDCINFVRRSNIDGVIILPPVSESKLLADALQQKSINYVRMASVDLDDHQNIVVSDDRAALSDLARYMVSLGHKDIGIISGPQQYYSSKERLEGFVETLNGLGVDVPKNRVIEGKNSFESGIECARQLLIQSPRVKAIFANVAI